MKFPSEAQDMLAAPFPDDMVSWKPQVTTTGREKRPIMRNGQQVAGCVAHIDARAVMNRLDEAVGAGNWSDSYEIVDRTHVVCTLTVYGVSKTDVGEANTEGFADPLKGAFSDALKRAAVKFGIARYLYDMEMKWLPFDGRRITGQTPSQNVGKQTKRPAKKKNSAASAPEVVQPSEVGNTAKDERAQHNQDGSAPADAWEREVANAPRTPYDTGNTETDNRIAECRAVIEGYKRMTLMQVAEQVVEAQVGYKHENHVYNALKQHDVFKRYKSSSGIDTAVALEIFDWAMARKL